MSWAAAGARPAEEARRSQRVRHVLLDGVVVMKIIKHCSENFPESVAGSVLGLDVGDNLEVTHSFAYPASAAASDGDGEEFELEMMKALREVNVDNNVVGWYQSTYLGSYCTRDTILHQFEFQENLPNSVVLIYDGVRTAQGQLSLKALRLTDAFCDAFRSKRITVESLPSVSPSTIFEELPIRFRNPLLVQALLIDLAEPGHGLDSATAPATGGAAAAARSGAATADRAGALGVAASAATAAIAGAGGAAGGEVDVDFSRLDLTTVPFLEKHLEFMTDVTDQMLRATNEASYVQRRADAMRRQREEWIARRRAENDARRAAGESLLPEEDLSLPFFRPLPPDARAKDPLDTLLMAAQVNNYAAQVNKFAGQSFGKLFLAQSLQKPAPAQ